jgi:riboflavin synthase
MFTGIIEATGIVQEVITEGTNRKFWIKSPLSPEFKVDQSVSHNGACLTVEEINGDLYRVTAIEETLKKTNLGSWASGTTVNLERSLMLQSRLDGHFVQGHVDTTAECVSVTEKGGSHEFEFRFPEKFAALVIEKGSISVNGISLTAFKVKKKRFTVAIIPYTFEHTNINTIKKGSIVNIEFDMIGKYIHRIHSIANT